MGGINIHLGDCQVSLDHFQGGVAQDALEGVNISPVAQVIYGKGVPEAVGGDVCNASLMAHVFHAL